MVSGVQGEMGMPWGNRNTEFLQSDGERVLTRINYNQKLFSSILLSSALQILDLQIYGGGSTSQAVR